MHRFPFLFLKYVVHCFILPIGLDNLDLTVIGILSLPYHMINGTKVIAVRIFYSIVCNICKYNIMYQIGQSLDFTMIGNPSCCCFYPLLVLECVYTQVVMTSLGEIKRLLPMR